MDWTKIMNKFRSRKNTDGQFTESEVERKSQIVSEFDSEQICLLEQTVQEFFIDLAIDLNFRMLCEMANPTMLWIDSIVVTCYEPAQSISDKSRAKIIEQNSNRKVSLWERLKNCLLGRGGRKT